MKSLSLTLAMTLISKVNFWNSHISGIGGPIYIEQKGAIHAHNRDLLVTKMRCSDLPDGDQVTSDVSVLSTCLILKENG